MSNLSISIGVLQQSIFCVASSCLGTIACVLLWRGVGTQTGGCAGVLQSILMPVSTEADLLCVLLLH